MIMKMTDRAWLSNQYRNFPLLDAALLFFIFAGIFGGWLLARSGLLFVFFFACCRGRFNGDLGIVR
jgi:hypothetical protein